MTITPSAVPHADESAVEKVAALILQSTQQAAQAILDASVHAAADIAQAATVVPTALSTPPPQGIDSEALVRAFETMQANQGQQGDPFNDGINLPFDPAIDTLVMEDGTRWDGNNGAEPVIPSPYRESFDIVPPGTPIVPQLPRLDQ